ncbi:hypothetical protein M422DRAFT_272499 [Sphaerobolus stellatus SS14]|uniref:Uncharacterized protein n=1 Tax=Sphaerobolus stellatus (strain SS14) TaxID=990650 RepID=A0A0C9UMI1_SPHS4|nr:hypothetical protein M422DRAFT_272499 [Sphaerobolus stellatus SS14]
MSPMLSVAAPDSARISTLLPTVKCSNCAQPVALSQLSDHVCSPNTPISPRPQSIRSLKPKSPSPPSIRAFSPKPPMPSPPKLAPPIQQAAPPTQYMGPPIQQRTQVQPPHRPPALNIALATAPPAQIPFPSVAKTPPSHPADYMPGGASGMAGVGRRAFQVAAHAALFAQHLQGHHTVNRYPSAPEVPFGLQQDHRDIAPQYLDIGTSRGGSHISTLLFLLLHYPLAFFTLLTTLVSSYTPFIILLYIP